MARVIAFRGLPSPTRPAQTGLTQLDILQRVNGRRRVAASLSPVDAALMRNLTRIRAQRPVSFMVLENWIGRIVARLENDLPSGDRAQ